MEVYFGSQYFVITIKMISGEKVQRCNYNESPQFNARYDLNGQYSV